MSTASEQPAAPLSAGELGQLLGDALPRADSVSDAELALVEGARMLLDAVMRTAVDDEERRRIAAELERAAAALRAATLDEVVRLVRHPDGRIENVVQAGSGRCNPRALRIRFDDLSLPAPGTVATAIEVRGHCVLDASATGPPGRAHGGIVTTILDEALGAAIMRAGRNGMTAALEVAFRGVVPLGVELDVTARCVAIDGRKSTATAELLVGDTLVADARALFIASRDPR